MVDAEGLLPRFKEIWSSKSVEEEFGRLDIPALESIVQAAEEKGLVSTKENLRGIAEKAVECCRASSLELAFLEKDFKDAVYKCNEKKKAIRGNLIGTVGFYAAAVGFCIQILSDILSNKPIGPIGLTSPPVLLLGSILGAGYVTRELKNHVRDYVGMNASCLQKMLFYKRVKDLPITD